MTPIDPTTIRLSEHFLLSDFMGNHSAYTKGFPNVFADPTGSKIAEAEHLCNTLLEPLLAQHGPISISYGYLSPSLSKRIITYQDPNMPSYHRWDKGAAADICVHSHVKGTAPIYLAHAIDEEYDYSRMITYSESPYICVATQLSEGDSPRKAFYENRYMGSKGGRPMYIKKSASTAGRRKQFEELDLEHDWRGEGYPTYHGSGIRQMQHIRCSKYSMVSDFLYSTHALSEGIPNAPDIRQYCDVFEAAGRTYDGLLKLLDVPRISIVRGFESFRFNDYPLFSWKNHFAIDFIPPSYVSADDAATVAMHLMSLDGQINAVSVDNVNGIVRIIGVDQNGS